MNATLVQEFNARCLPEPNSGCWLWTGNCLRKRGGYGCFTMRPNLIMVRAHRLSWAIHNGPIAKNQHVLHRCDNPACVNPDHLFLGDQAANMADKTRKGRQNYGERHGKAKLSLADVLAIRADDRPHREIALQYNVSRTTVSQVRGRKSWARVRE